MSGAWRRDEERERERERERETERERERERERQIETKREIENRQRKRESWCSLSKVDFIRTRNEISASARAEVLSKCHAHTGGTASIPHTRGKATNEQCHHLY